MTSLPRTSDIPAAGSGLVRGAMIGAEDGDATSVTDIVQIHKG